MNPSKQIVFFGSDSICLPILNYLNTDCSDLCQLRAVISQPDRRQGRGKKYQPNVVSQWAISNSVELLQPEIPDEALANWLIDKQVLASVVMAYGHYLPRFIREATPLGMVNLHGSLLPRYRGASPIETALSSGDSTTGVCLMQVGPQMDAGGVADAEKVCIEQFDTSISLRKKMGEACVPLMRRNLNKLIEGSLKFIPQESSQASFCRKITKEDGAIDFNTSVFEIDCRLRAFSSWPGSYFMHEGTTIKVGRTSLLKHSLATKPGTVTDTSDGVTVAATNGAICFHQLQRPGGRMLETRDFLNGYDLPVGTQLESTPSISLIVAS